MTNQAVELLRSYDGPKFRIMEVCGTHTHEIFRQGVRNLLSPQIDLISGPGCPVCVTEVGFIDEACWRWSTTLLSVPSGIWSAYRVQSKAWRRRGVTVRRSRWCTLLRTRRNMPENIRTVRWYSCRSDLRPRCPHPVSPYRMPSGGDLTTSPS